MTTSDSMAFADGDLDGYGPDGSSLVTAPSGAGRLSPRSPQTRYLAVPPRMLLDVPVAESWAEDAPAQWATTVEFDDPALAEGDGSGVPRALASPASFPVEAAPRFDPWADAAAPVESAVPGVAELAPTEPGVDIVRPRTDVVPNGRLVPPSELAQPAVTDEPSGPGPEHSRSSVDDDWSHKATKKAEASASRTRLVIEYAFVLFGALMVALVIKTLLFQAFWIPSASMETTLVRDDRVLVNKLSYRLHDVDRWQIVVFSRPDGWPRSDDDSDLIKRVIGLPGERIHATGGVVYVNDRPVLDEEVYLEPGTTTLDFPVSPGSRVWNGEDILIGPDEVFVMGDNRMNSADSRVHGPVAVDHLIGRAFVRVYPFSRLGGL